MAYDLKNAEEVKEYLKNLHTEYQFGCHKEKKAEVCHLLGDYKEAIEQNFSESQKLYKMTCDVYSFPKSCSKYGVLLSTGRAMKKDTKEGYKYLKKGCKLNDPYSCLVGGMLQLSSDDTGVDKSTRVKEGLQFLLKACDNYKMERACSYLAAIYLGGLNEDQPRDPKKAFEYSMKSCELGNPYACANVAQMHKNGDGAEKDEKLAQTFQKRAQLLHTEYQSQKTIKFHQGT